MGRCHGLGCFILAERPAAPLCVTGRNTCGACRHARAQSLPVKIKHVEISALKLGYLFPHIKRQKKLSKTSLEFSRPIDVFRSKRKCWKLHLFVITSLKFVKDQTPEASNELLTRCHSGLAFSSPPSLSFLSFGVYSLIKLCHDLCPCNFKMKNSPLFVQIHFKNMMENELCRKDPQQVQPCVCSEDGRPGWADAGPSAGAG